MSPSTGRQMVLVSLIVTTAVIGYDLTKSSQSGAAAGATVFRTVWSVSLLFLLLTILADLTPELAGPFAGLVALAVLVGRGGTVNTIVNLIPSGKGGTK